MCLTIWRFTRKKIAKKDIHCFKILILIDGKYYAPIRQVKYTLNEIYESELGKPNPVDSFLYRDIEEGFHTLANRKEAERLLLNVYPSSSCNNAVLCYAFIPKGAEYYKGAYAYCTGYASNKLIVTGVV